MTSTLSRRRIVAGSAWAVPAIAAACAAPAFAASRCVPGPQVMGWVDVFAGTTNPTNPVRVRATRSTQSTATFPSANFRAVTLTNSATGITESYLRLQSPQPGTANVVYTTAQTTQTITVAFFDQNGQPKPVTNVSLVVYDIDRTDSDPAVAQDLRQFYQDQIVIPAGAPQPSVTLTPRLQGSGTSTDPIFALAVDTNGLPLQRDEPGGPHQSRSKDFQATLTWVGPVTSVSFTYRQFTDGTIQGRDIYPTVWVSPVSFTASC